jgi:hypothetical protein
MFVGSMPLLRDGAGIYRDVLHGEPATVEPEQ